MSLLQDFNSNNYNVSLNQLDNVVPDIPNVTVTTIQLIQLKQDIMSMLKSMIKH